MEFGVGTIVEGKVTGITKFGAFVSLPEGKSGLVHISEIAYSYVNDVKDHLKEGQEVKVKVIGIDENGRINLSIKKAMDPPPRPAGHGGQGRPGGRDRGFNGGFRGKPTPAEPTCPSCARPSAAAPAAAAGSNSIRTSQIPASQDAGIFLCRGEVIPPAPATPPGR